MDTSGVLTIFGLIIAIVAIIPKERLLVLSVGFSWFDWLIIILTLLTIHYIIYFPVLYELGFYVDIGYWSYGFNPQNTIYLIFLALTLYLWIRAKYSKIGRSNIKAATELFENLLLEGKYSELIVLADKYIESIIEVSNSKSSINRIAQSIKPATLWETKFLQEKASCWDKVFPRQRTWLFENIKSQDKQKALAENILLRMISNDGFVKHLSDSNPYLGIKILDSKVDMFLKETFITSYFNNLIENTASVYYYELSNTDAMQDRIRYGISNYKLINYLFNDVKVAEKLGVYKPVGDKVCDILDYDEKLITRYNGPLRTYFEQGRISCPINISIDFFDVMIVRSMHAGIRWHMWLIYFEYFVEKILKKIEPSTLVDMQREWPTPFHYILYHIVEVLVKWLYEYGEVGNKENLVVDEEEEYFELGAIPKSAALVLGSVIFMIITSRKIHDDFKQYLFEIPLNHIDRTRSNQDFESLNNVLIQSILRNGWHNELNNDYIQSLSHFYYSVDHILRHTLNDFESALGDVKSDLGLR